ncbi:MAG: h16, partial [Burkholderiales bacterium]|nr:h16 [Burkholderiales bacterium]
MDQGRARGQTAAAVKGPGHTMRRLAYMLIAAAACAGSGAATAQTYPAKSIRFVVPFAPGGGNDILGRVVAQKLNEGFGV